MTQDWHGKTAIITGGSSGIGFALAQALAAEGMRIVISSSSGAKLQVAAEKLRAVGADVLAVPCDVTDCAQVYALAAKIRETHGGTDLLCANAGATTMGQFVDHKDADWDWAIDVNLRGITHCVQAFYPEMAARGAGTILLTGSQTALAPDWVVGHGPYVAAKAAVLGLATSLRAEASKLGVKVSLLIPAATETNVSEAARKVPPGQGAITMNEGVPMPDPDYPFMMPAEEVAARAIAGLREDAPIIATHAGMRPLVEDYFARILAAYDAAANYKAG